MGQERQMTLRAGNTACNAVMTSHDDQAVIIIKCMCEQQNLLQNLLAYFKINHLLLPVLHGKAVGPLVFRVRRNFHHTCPKGRFQSRRERAATGSGANHDVVTGRRELDGAAGGGNVLGAALFYATTARVAEAGSPARRRPGLPVLVVAAEISGDTVQPASIVAGEFGEDEERRERREEEKCCGLERRDERWEHFSYWLLQTDAVKIVLRLTNSLLRIAEKRRI